MEGLGLVGPLEKHLVVFWFSGFLCGSTKRKPCAEQHVVFVTVFFFRLLGRKRAGTVHDGIRLVAWLMKVLLGVCCCSCGLLLWLLAVVGY